MNELLDPNSEASRRARVICAAVNAAWNTGDEPLDVRVLAAIKTAVGAELTPEESAFLERIGLRAP